MIVSVDLLATSGDITLSWTSPVYPKLYSKDHTINPIGRPISVDEDTWIGTMLNMGALFGPLIFSIIGESLGSKTGLLTAGLFHIISYLILAFAEHVSLFYFARFLGGVGFAGAYTLLPTYIAEISEETHRGTLSQTMNVFWAIGNFIPYAIGPFLTIQMFNIILATIPFTFFVLFFLFGTESPFFFVKRNKIDKAQRVLASLRAKTEGEVQKELEDITLFCNLKTNGRISDIIKDRVARKYLLICAILISTQELSGFSSITYHLQLIFEEVETGIGAEFAAIIVGVSMIISSIIGPILIDKLGRRFLTITSCFGMCIAHIIIGSYFYIYDFTNLNVEGFTWVPIFSLILYICAFNCGICSVPWTLISELFPSNIKQMAAFSMATLCSIVSFIMNSCFNTLNAVLGSSGLFWFYALVCLSTGIFSIFFVPETKGKTFLEIQQMLHFDTSKESEDKTDIKKEKMNNPNRLV